jgi:hypothetical protein
MLVYAFRLTVKPVVDAVNKALAATNPVSSCPLAFKLPCHLIVVNSSKLVTHIVEMCGLLVYCGQLL